MSASLNEQVQKLGLTEHVRFTGEIPHNKVNEFLCASDVFALATHFEGWANVFFEAMACGLPVITTDICGNAEVVRNGENGLLVPFGNREALADAIDKALTTREAIINYAHGRTWEQVADEVYEQFNKILS